MVNISNRVLVSFLLKNVSYDYNDWEHTPEDFPIKTVKYLGLKYDSDLVQSYIFDFISRNIDLLLSDDGDVSKYETPTLETYKVEGEERYSQATADLYYINLESYSLEYLNFIKDGDTPPFKVETDYITKIDSIYDYGVFDRKDIIDTYDTEVIIDRITLLQDNPEKKDGMINESIMYETNIEKIDKMIKMLTERKDLLTKKRK